MVFEQCYAAASWTKPAVSSLFTGCLPPVHKMAIGQWCDSPLPVLSTDLAGMDEAFAAGGLKHLSVGTFTLELDERADAALWRDATGSWQGVLQGWRGGVPAPLRALTSNWLRLGVPAVFEGKP